jgi:hypothetical protein
MIRISVVAAAILCSASTTGSVLAEDSAAKPAEKPNRVERTVNRAVQGTENTAKRAGKFVEKTATRAGKFVEKTATRAGNFAEGTASKTDKAVRRTLE